MANNKTPIISIGLTGQLAKALKDLGTDKNKDILFYGREDCDLASPENIIRDFLSELPTCSGIIIAAAYTAVDAAESDKDTAKRVNSIAPALIAAECAKRKIPVIYVSTDYVFSGVGDTPWTETDEVDPLNYYGQTKLDGEIAVLQSDCVATVLRTSWVFDGVGKNFLTTMLRLGETKEQLNIVGDQIGHPTFAGHLAQACLTALEKNILRQETTSQIFNVSGTGRPISWAEFATEIFEKTKTFRPHNINITPVPSSEYPTAAQRPSYSVLNTDHFEQYYNTKLLDWEIGLDLALEQWKAQRT